VDLQSNKLKLKKCLAYREIRKEISLLTSSPTAAGATSSLITFIVRESTVDLAIYGFLLLGSDVLCGVIV